MFSSSLEKAEIVLLGINEAERYYKSEKTLNPVR